MASNITDGQLITLFTNITILLSRYGSLVLVILGTVGNTLNIIVFRQQKLCESSCTIYFFISACIDLILTLTIALRRVLNTYNLDYSAIISVLCKMRHFTYFTLSSLSVWMTALATIDRFIISSPVATRRHLSSFRNTYRLIAASTVLLALIFADLFYCADVVFNGVISSCSASTSKQCGYYNQIARLMTILFIPGTVILVFSIGIIRNLRTVKMVTNIVSRTGNNRHQIRKTDRELFKVRSIPKELYTFHDRGFFF